MKKKKKKKGGVKMIIKRPQMMPLEVEPAYQSVIVTGEPKVDENAFAQKR